MSFSFWAHQLLSRFQLFLYKRCARKTKLFCHAWVTCVSDQKLKSITEYWVLLIQNYVFCVREYFLNSRCSRFTVVDEYSRHSWPLTTIVTDTMYAISFGVNEKCSLNFVSPKSKIFFQSRCTNSYGAIDSVLKQWSKNTYKM